MRKALSEASPSEAAELAALAVTGDQVTIYLGAGVSAAEPTAAPTAGELVELLKPAIESLGLSIFRDDGSTKRLDELADEAEQAGVLDALKAHTARLPVFRRGPNEAHESVAILLREGVVVVLSANWDQGVERAGTKHRLYVIPTITDDDRLNRRLRGTLNKLHGCVTRPSSLLIATSDLEQLPAWARNQAEFAIAGGTVAFIGLATVADYIGERVRQIVSIAGDGGSIWVVSRSISETWRALLESHQRSRLLESDAAEFLDDVLRAVVREALFRARGTAERLVRGDASPASLLDGTERLVTAMSALDAASVWSWLAAGAVDLEEGAAVLTSEVGLRAMLAVGLLVDSRPVRVEGNGPTAAVRVDAAYVEVVISDGAESPTLVRAEQARSTERREGGVYRDPGLPVIHVCAGHAGILPAPGLLSDIVAEAVPTSVMDGPRGGTHYWVPAEKLLQGGTAPLPWSA